MALLIKIMETSYYNYECWYENVQIENNIYYNPPTEKLKTKNMYIEIVNIEKPIYLPFVGPLGLVIVNKILNVDPDNYSDKILIDYIDKTL